MLQKIGDLRKFNKIAIKKLSAFEILLHGVRFCIEFNFDDGFENIKEWKNLRFIGFD